MTKALRLAMVACWLAAAGGVQAARAATDGWRVFHSEAGGFRVEMPGEPKSSRSVEKTFVGNITTHLFTVELPSEEFAVEYSDLPPLALALAGPGTILKKAKAALLKDIRGAELTFRLFRQKGNDRAELSYVGLPDKNPGVSGFAWFFLRGDRIYVVHAMLSNGQHIDPVKVARFLGSFRTRL